MSWVTLATVLLTIIQHFLKNKTPEARKNYVKRVESMSQALVDGDADRINDLFFELRDEVRQGDEDGLGAEATVRRELHSKPGVDR
jgi:uncharacterized membrane protein YvbJ